MNVQTCSISTCNKLNLYQCSGLYRKSMGNIYVAQSRPKWKNAKFLRHSLIVSNASASNNIIFIEKENYSILNILFKKNQVEVFPCPNLAIEYCTCSLPTVSIVYNMYSCIIRTPKCWPKYGEKPSGTKYNTHST